MGCFALVVLSRLKADTCGQNPRRVLKAQHGRDTPRIPYFTCKIAQE